MFYRVDFCHGEGHSKTHYSHRKRFNCCVLEDLQVWSNRSLIPETSENCQAEDFLNLSIVSILMGVALQIHVSSLSLNCY